MQRDEVAAHRGLGSVEDAREFLDGHGLLLGEDAQDRCVALFCEHISITPLAMIYIFPSDLSIASKSVKVNHFHVGTSRKDTKEKETGKARGRL